MKKILLFAVTAALLAMIGCQKEALIENQSNTSVDDREKNIDFIGVWLHKKGTTGGIYLEGGPNSTCELPSGMCQLLESISGGENNTPSGIKATWSVPAYAKVIDKEEILISIYKDHDDVDWDLIVKDYGQGLSPDKLNVLLAHLKDYYVIEGDVLISGALKENLISRGDYPKNSRYYLQAGKYPIKYDSKGGLMFHPRLMIK